MTLLNAATRRERGRPDSGRPTAPGPVSGPADRAMTVHSPMIRAMRRPAGPTVAASPFCSSSSRRCWGACVARFLQRNVSPASPFQSRLLRLLPQSLLLLFLFSLFLQHKQLKRPQHLPGILPLQNRRRVVAVQAQRFFARALSADGLAGGGTRAKPSSNSYSSILAVILMCVA